MIDGFSGIVFFSKRRFRVKDTQFTEDMDVFEAFGGILTGFGSDFTGPGGAGGNGLDDGVIDPRFVDLDSSSWKKSVFFSLSFG